LFLKEHTDACSPDNDDDKPRTAIAFNYEEQE
jgi:hypothetical protein